ncbi:hypothetical protein D3C86_2241480 [compost metagenome]
MTARVHRQRGIEIDPRFGQGIYIALALFAIAQGIGAVDQADLFVPDIDEVPGGLVGAAHFVNTDRIQP